MLHYRKISFTILLLFISLISFSYTPPSIFDKISYAEQVNVLIEIDMESLTADKYSEVKHAAVLTFEDEAKTTQQWNIKAKLRGRYRRMKCTQTPPLKLYFDKSDLKNAGLADFNDLKLVNYCIEDRAQAKALIMKEYLAYKMYNEISSESYRVQLLKITYQDIKTGRKLKQWGFLIEDTAQLRARIGANKLEKNKISNTSLFDKNQANTIALFQYMIGNSDWQLNNGKNIKVLEKEGQLKAIPYDFDFSGLVKAPYASGNSNYNLTSIEERVYLGTLEGLKNIDSTIALFEKNKKAFYKVIQKNKHLSYETKIEMFDYLNSFYKNLNKEAITNAIPENRDNLKGLTYFDVSKE